MSDDIERRGRDVDDEDEPPAEPEAPFEWPSPSEWGRGPEPEQEEPSVDPYPREPSSPWEDSSPREPSSPWEQSSPSDRPSQEPFSWHEPEPYSSEPYPRGVLESGGPPHRTRDPLARLFPGLPHSVRVGLDWILTIAGAILIVLALKQWVVNPYRIPSSSMEPTLNCAKPAVGCLGDSSDRVLACRICLDFGAPSRGDIVVFNTPPKAVNRCGEGGTFVKRVIGLPGETVHEDDNGFISIRGPNSKTFVTLKEPYLSSERRLADSAHFGETWKVPPGDYFMMGDNRSQSCDSRSWGSVPRSDLIGTVFFVYWPPDRIGFR
jgi:signal peptidase I